MSEKDKDEKKDIIEDDIEFVEGGSGKSGAGKRIPVRKAQPKTEEEPEKEAAGTPEEAGENGPAAPVINMEELEARDARIADLQLELARFKDAYVRKMADMDNLRKRLERDKNDFYQYALTDIMVEFLTIKDNLERALDRPEDESNGRSFREGIDLIYRMFGGLLAKNGVQEVEVKDGKFDPNVHQATSSVEVEGIEEPEIAEVLQKGYLLNGRLIRPAMVRVNIPKKD